MQSFFKPYHDKIGEKLASLTSQDRVPALIAVHTCSPVFDRVVRPWHVGIMWDTDPRIPVPFMKNLEAMGGICVGDNEPYSGKHPARLHGGLPRGTARFCHMSVSRCVMTWWIPRKAHGIGLPYSPRGSGISCLTKPCTNGCA